MTKINTVPSRAETARLAEVRRYAILDTPPDGAFDRITRLAVRIFRVPVAIISVVDHDRIWFKSRQGIDFNQIARDPGLCASAILQDVPYILTDAAADPHALANPLVSGAAGLRFYAGSHRFRAHSRALRTSRRISSSSDTIPASSSSMAVSRSSMLRGW